MHVLQDGRTVQRSSSPAGREKFDQDPSSHVKRRVGVHTVVPAESANVAVALRDARPATRAVGSVVALAFDVATRGTSHCIRGFSTRSLVDCRQLPPSLCLRVNFGPFFCN